ncbi:hypothetical protein WN72_09885 [Bradyrhizobium arachidis]|uniref:Uncharacterized protein n=1 Tax=Bradyrhizobium arachidis TaxID=858423 RepID=A0AAE7TFL5_9BRAD|nr:hypothetical protein WN72_09885 [Bradyrhizobium arachidis]
MNWGARRKCVRGAHFRQAWFCFHFSVSTVIAAAGVAFQLEAQDEGLARETLGIAGSKTPLPSMWPGKSMDLSDSKYQDAGWAVLAGVFATRSATLGATGVSAIFDGERSLIKMCGTDCFDRDTLVGDLGSRWMLPDITYKPWPTCRWMHQPLTRASVLNQKFATSPRVVPGHCNGRSVRWKQGCHRLTLSIGTAWDLRYVVR